MQTFYNFIDTHIGTTQTEWRQLEKKMVIRRYKKGEEIFFENDIWSEIMYINSGIVRSYIINAQGKDFTRQFYFNSDESSVANLFVLDLTSLTTQMPSKRGFTVLEDCETIVFSRESLSTLSDNPNNGNASERKRRNSPTSTWTDPLAICRRKRPESMMNICNLPCRTSYAKSPTPLSLRIWASLRSLCPESGKIWKERGN